VDILPPDQAKAKLDEDAKAKVTAFKNLPKRKGRPPKEFGPLVKMAASVLRDAGMSYADIAAELKVTPQTIMRALRDKAVKIETSDMNRVREGFSTHIAQIINKMLVAAHTDEYIENLKSAKNPGLVIGLATMIDKLNLLTGKPTSILETKDLADSVQRQLKDLEELEKALQQSVKLPQSPKDN
jgi:predicted transcriptional regulator